MLGTLSQVRAQLVAEGRLTRNVAALVDRVSGKAKKAPNVHCGSFRLGRQRFSELFGAPIPPVLRLDVIADTHAADCGDPSRAGIAGPVGRPRDVGVFGRQPSADLGQNDAAMSRIFTSSQS